MGSVRTGAAGFILYRNYYQNSITVDSSMKDVIVAVFVAVVVTFLICGQAHAASQPLEKDLKLQLIALLTMQVEVLQQQLEEVKQREQEEKDTARQERQCSKVAGQIQTLEHDLTQFDLI